MTDPARATPGPWRVSQLPGESDVYVLDGDGLLNSETICRLKGSRANQRAEQIVLEHNERAALLAERDRLRAALLRFVETEGDATQRVPTLRRGRTVAVCSYCGMKPSDPRHAQCALQIAREAVAGAQ